MTKFLILVLLDNELGGCLEVECDTAEEVSVQVAMLITNPPTPILSFTVYLLPEPDELDLLIDAAYLN